MTQFPGSLIAIEYYIPAEVVKNSFFQDKFPEWKVEKVSEKTGVVERRISQSGETAYDLALIAAKKMINNHPELIEKIDGIIFCTQSPDYIMPSNAFLLQKDLGLKNATIVFDYNLACSGYVYGLFMASSFIKTGIVKNVLLVTADTYSKFLRENDRSTRMLFGDGASVSWIGSESNNSFHPLISSFADFEFGSDGKGWDKFIIKSGGCRNPRISNAGEDGDDKIYMNGIQVVNFVNHQVVKQIISMLEKHGIASRDIDQFFIHQASRLALISIEKKLNIDKNKIFSNIEMIGNTVSSSLPILIKDYFSQASLPRGARLFLCGFGVGFSWGSLIAIK